jgi:hypothetical protein
MPTTTIHGKKLKGHLVRGGIYSYFPLEKMLLISHQITNYVTLRKLRGFS